MKGFLCLFALAIAPAVFAQDQGPVIHKAFATCGRIGGIPSLPQGSCTGPYLIVLLSTPNPDAVGFEVSVTAGDQTQTQLIRSKSSNGFQTGFVNFSGITEEQRPIVSAVAVARSGAASTSGPEN